ncbi:TraR/DksA family transcriptional regulator [Ferruginibacter albus]|uniref:TraR/DksA family transcriptional regulator n=1 Tax=Ferruginibacter albus TaxID=2875540 RepID=UPI001CC45D8C|nr:TraR/DksA C4-type zinc finger protein [Ferruginibacter albus]UAY51817.1 TraR/DksA C4-type zinc finger protein [Ferruginibacter albus]
MATKKKVTPKKAAKPIKKSAPAKKAAPKKVAKKPVAKKPVAKAKSKPAPKPAAKKAVKPAPKKAAPVKKVAAKAPAKQVKPAPKPAPKPAAKVVAAKAITPAKPVASKDVKAKDIKVTPAKPVVIPKITTKTVRKYQPEFTKSVLDRPKQDPGAPTMRYSDTELAEFREIIMRKLDAAKKELSYLHGLITRKDEMGGDETDNRYMTMEDGSLSMEREQLSQMASRQITFIDHLEKALMRIENKTYGICRVTGKLIDKARLRAVPHATLSIEAKMGSK